MIDFSLVGHLKSLVSFDGGLCVMLVQEKALQYTKWWFFMKQPRGSTVLLTTSGKVGEKAKILQE